MYLSLMGKEGLREVGTQCMHKAAYLRAKLAELGGVSLPFSGPVYNEFVVRTPFPAAEILADLEHEQILGGIPLGRFFADCENDFLVAVTELHTREMLDRFVSVLRAAIARERR
jgi:glycine dehydrogenase subunit 1